MIPGELEKAIQETKEEVRLKVFSAYVRHTLSEDWNEGRWLFFVPAEWVRRWDYEMGSISRMDVFEQNVNLHENELTDQS